MQWNQYAWRHQYCDKLDAFAGIKINIPLCNVQLFSTKAVLSLLCLCRWRKQLLLKERFRQLAALLSKGKYRETCKQVWQILAGEFAENNCGKRRPPSLKKLHFTTKSSLETTNSHRRAIIWKKKPYHDNNVIDHIKETKGFTRPRNNV
jgi:hypothetical protein